MKHINANHILSVVARIIVALSLLVSIFFVYSFKVYRIGDDFMKQLGITKTAADEKITNSILGGYLDAYGLKNAKNIVTGDKEQVTKDLIVYTKMYVNTPAFKTDYETLRQNNKPKKETIKTPAELKNEYIAAIKKMITDSETGLKTANSTMKPIYENMIVEGKKQLAAAESPNNPQFSAYEKNYSQMLKDIDSRHDAQLKEWETIYPSDQMHFVKHRLQEFLKITSDIDFNAELITKNGKKVFVKQEYEDKDNRWKMAFRAGREVVEPSRALVKQWIEEIK